MKNVHVKQEFCKNDTFVAKGIAILLMFFYHLFETRELLESMQVDYRPFSTETFLMLSGFGNICVAVFAFLSAYGITKGLMAREGTLADRYRDAAGRCLRLTGNFAAMYISVNLLWFRYFDYAKLYGEGWQGFMLAVTDLLGLAPLFDTPTLNMTWWYMELAVLIIFMVPLIDLLVKKIGGYAVIPGILFPLAVDLNPDLKRYFPVIVFGAVAARERWFEKLFALDVRKIWKALAGALLLFFCLLFRGNYMVHTYFLWIVDAPVAFVLIWYAAEVVGSIPGISRVLHFLGRHSMNLFFVHTFFYMAIYQPYIYAFRYAGLTFLLLLAVTLVYSVVLELVKSGCRRLVKAVLF